jgi:hypothetical protein
MHAYVSSEYLFMTEPLTTASTERGRAVAMMWAFLTPLLLVIPMAGSSLSWRERALMFASPVLTGIIAALTKGIQAQLMAFGFAGGLVLVSVPLFPAAVLSILLGAPQLGFGFSLLVLAQLACVVVLIRGGILTLVTETTFNLLLTLGCAMLVVAIAASMR